MDHCSILFNLYRLHFLSKINSQLPTRVSSSNILLKLKTGNALFCRLICDYTRYSNHKTVHFKSPNELDFSVDPTKSIKRW